MALRITAFDHQFDRAVDESTVFRCLSATLELSLRDCRAMAQRSASTRRSRGREIIFLGASMFIGIEPSIAAIDLTQQRQFDIAPQQLTSALLKFSAQSDIQVTVPGQLAEGKQSLGVVGRFNAGSALAILLKDTTLRYEVVDGSTGVITGAAERKATRNDYQKITNPVLAVAPVPGQDIKVAQATSTSAQTTSVQIPTAASSAASSDSTSLSEIVVSGSSIKQINGETALPVQILRHEDIARTGATTVEELCRAAACVS